VIAAPDAAARRLHREAALAEAAISLAHEHAELCHARLCDALGDRVAAESHRETAREYRRDAHRREDMADDAWPTDRSREAA